MKLKHLRRLKDKRSRLAVSEVVGATILIAVTLSVGFAAWAWARSAAVNSESSYGNQVGASANYLDENFLIVNANFTSSAPQNVTVWFYNSGNTVVYIKQVFISNVTSGSSLQWSNTSLSSLTTSICSSKCLVLPIKSVVPITLKVSTSFMVGVTYQIKALGLYGSTYSYMQTR